MSSLALLPASADARAGSRDRRYPAARSAGRAAMPRHDDRDPCGGERILDFAICLILAAVVVGLLLLAL